MKKEKEEVKQVCPFNELKKYCSHKFNTDIRTVHNKCNSKHRCSEEFCPLDLNTSGVYTNQQRR
jgi:hypothetical protein